MKLLLVKEIAAVARVPESTVHHWLLTDQMVSVKIGRHRRVRADIAAAFLGFDDERHLLEAVKAESPQPPPQSAPQKRAAAR